MLFRVQGLGGVRGLGSSIPIGFRVKGSKCTEILEGMASWCLQDKGLMIAALRL